MRSVRLAALSIGGAVLLLLTVRSSVASLHRARGSSDAPAIRDGEVFLVNRMAYDVRLPFLGTPVARRGDPRRGDLVLFAMPGNGAFATKRVVAVPGDSAGAAVVPAGHFYLLGDNRQQSLDSRDFGPVPREAIRGRVIPLPNPR